MSNCCQSLEEKVQLPKSCSTTDLEEKLCPRCKKEGQIVKNVTVKSLVQDDLVNQIGIEDYFLCTSPSCEVVYYNNHTNKIFLKNNLKVRVWFKETEDPIPVCYCANVTEKQIWDEIVVKKQAKNLQDIQKYTGAMTGGRCKYTNPSGKCCGAVVNAAIKKALDEIENA